ncbi:DUF6716 putative glycosyltransferase [Jatrophihabitans sp.]|uniref:DUF6716 putative glycosyltransferase n=1 Tax=Jatrophihabitans sp. TaxID=1932789 RepID=UPI0030C66D53|nr:uncharacterized protein [Jatrophihabitans sp.]
MSWEVEVIADSDSRWKWGETLARRLAPDAGTTVHATLLLGRSCPTDQQLRDVGGRADTLHRLSMTDAVNRIATSRAQVVVLACIGGSVQSLLYALSRAWQGRTNRPVVVTGYVGLVYERVVDGLVSRAGSDVVLANSANDADRFRAIYADLGADPDSVVQTALPFLGGAPYDPTAAGRDRPFTLTFVSQPGVPETKVQRRFVVRQAAEHARRHPERSVIMKLRGRVGERTTHVEPYHYSSLVPARELPANLEFAYGAMSPVLDRTDLCVTVSSTAAIEAMHRGIPTGILTDFGIRESLGNQLFLGSGAFTSWRALHEGAVPRPREEWMARNGVHDPAPYTAASARVAQLVEQGASLPPLRPWLDLADAGGYLPDLLARYGVGVDGSAVHDPGPPPFARRAARAVARRAYGVGVRVLEPRIKRMAQL